MLSTTRSGQSYATQSSKTLVRRVTKGWMPWLPLIHWFARTKTNWNSYLALLVEFYEPAQGLRVWLMRWLKCTGLQDRRTYSPYPTLSLNPHFATHQLIRQQIWYPTEIILAAYRHKYPSALDDSLIESLPLITISGRELPAFQTIARVISQTR